MLSSFRERNSVIMLTRRPKVVGLTGGMGAGKSTVAQIFKRLGVAVVSADEIAKEILSPGSQTVGTIGATLGKDLILSNGSLDRGKLRKLISEDPRARTTLDSIMHPQIQSRSKAEFAERLRKGAPFVLYEAPLLFEANSAQNMDAVICVIAEDALRISRVRERDSLDVLQVEKLMASQMSQEEKSKRSDFVIRNNGDEAALAVAAEEIYKKIMGLPLI